MNLLIKVSEVRGKHADASWRKGTPREKNKPIRSFNIDSFSFKLGWLRRENALELKK